MASGFKEIQHTADWELLVWAPVLEALFAQSACGMNWLMGVELSPDTRSTLDLELVAPDAESLLVSFLNEILFQMETTFVGYDGYDLKVEQCTLIAHLTGAPLKKINKGIKAVTYHNLVIHRKPDGFETTIVFDV